MAGIAKPAKKAARASKTRARLCECQEVTTAALRGPSSLLFFS